jgi:hypothetical protein
VILSGGEADNFTVASWDEKPAVRKVDLKLEEGVGRKL